MKLFYSGLPSDHHYTVPDKLTVEIIRVNTTDYSPAEPIMMNPDDFVTVDLIDKDEKMIQVTVAHTYELQQAD